MVPRHRDPSTRPEKVYAWMMPRRRRRARERPTYASCHGAATTPSPRPRERVATRRFAAYVHDVEHVVLDNLQFMTQAGPRDASRFEAQDRAIARFRDFATRRGVHVVLVVHPRKEDPTQKLALTSIYGGAKAAQEADNVLILQAPAPPPQAQSQAPIPKWVEVAKNRYAGTLGSVMMAFNDTTCRYYELSAGASASSSSGAAAG